MAKIRSVLLPDDLNKLLEEKAKGKTITEIIIQALRSYLEPKISQSFQKRKPEKLKPSVKDQDFSGPTEKNENSSEEEEEWQENFSEDDEDWQ